MNMPHKKIQNYKNLTFLAVLLKIALLMEARVLAIGLRLALFCPPDVPPPSSLPRPCWEWCNCCGVDMELSIVTMLFPLPWGSERRGTDGDPEPPPPPPPVKLVTLWPPLAIPKRPRFPPCTPRPPLMEEKKKSTSNALSSVTTTEGCLLVPLRSWLTAVLFRRILRGLNMAEIPENSDLRRLFILLGLAGFLYPAKNISQVTAKF